MTGDESTVAVYRLVCGCGLRTRWTQKRSNARGWQRISNGEEQAIWDLSKRLDCCDSEAVIQESETPEGEVVW